ncbi:16832_t:CDS:1, partial [Gigaspora margarita]
DMERHPRKTIIILMSKEKRNNTLTPTSTDTRGNTTQLKAQQTNRQEKTKIERQIEQIGKLKLVTHNTQGQNE